MKLPITTIILTYNEELNLETCLKSIADWVDEIIVVDSHSTDATLNIAKKYGARICQREFKNQADQFNWALDNVEIKKGWILRLDADEYITPELADEIKETLSSPSIIPAPPREAKSAIHKTENQPDKPVIPAKAGIYNAENQPNEITGFYIKRRVYFLGRWIKHGGYYPTWFLRLFRKGMARYEGREVDEHAILLEGKAEKLKNDFVDDNQKDLKWWTSKMNNYSTREAKERLKSDVPALSRNPNSNDSSSNSADTESHKLGGQAQKKRWLKNNFYGKLPLFFRGCLYFHYRYFFRLGFLDGKEGLIFHFLQAFWHQFLIDAKIYERSRKR